MANYKTKDKAPSGFLKFLLSGVVLVVAFVLFSLVFAAVVQMFYGVGFSDLVNDMYFLSMLSDLLLFVFAALGICLLGGSCLLKISGKKIGESFKTCAYIVVVSVLFALFDLFSAIFSEETYTVFPEGWQRTLVIIFVMCVFIGLAEEAIFRGIIMHGFLALGGRGKKSVLACVIIASLLFGLAHVVTNFQDLANADANYIAQMALKTLQTTFVGISLAAATMRTRNIVGPGLVHATFDFVALFMYAVVFGGSSDAIGEYVTTGAEAASAVTQYIVMCIIFLPAAIIGIRQILKCDVPDRGAFYRYVVPGASGPGVFYPYGYVPPAAVAGAVAAAAGAMGQAVAPVWNQQGQTWQQPGQAWGQQPVQQQTWQQPQAQQPWQQSGQQQQTTWQQPIVQPQQQTWQQPQAQQTWQQSGQQQQTTWQQPAVQPQQQAWQQPQAQQAWQQPAQQQAWGQQQAQPQTPTWSQPASSAPDAPEPGETSSQQQ